MRILLVATFFPPQHAVASLRTFSFASEWARQGHEVTVLTTAKRANQHGLARDIGEFDVVQIPYRGPRAIEWIRRHRGQPAASPTLPPAASPAAGVAPDADPGSGGGRNPIAPLIERFRSRSGIYAARRMPDLSDGWVQPAIGWAEGQTPWDLCVSSSGPYTPHLVARSLRSSGQVSRWIADFRDLWVDNHLGGGVWPFTLRERALQRDCLMTCDMAVTVSDGMAEILRRSDGIGETPVHVVHNGFDPEELAGLAPEPVALPSSTPANESDGRLIRLVYTGSVHRHGQDASTLFEAIARLHRDRRPGDPRFEVTVAGSPTAPWTEWADRAGVPEAVRTLGILPRDESLRLQRDADALLSVTWAGRRAGGLSGKVFEYLAWSPPVLVIGGDGDAPIVRLVGSCGRGVHAGSDVAEIARTLAALAAGELDEGPADRPRINTFTRPALARRVLDLAADHFFGASTGEPRDDGRESADQDRRTVGRRRVEGDVNAAVAPAARVAHRPA